MALNNPLLDVNVQLDDGTSGIPSLAFRNSPTSGLFLKSPNVIGLSIAGTEVASWTSTGPVESGTIDLSDGTAAAPSLSFTNATTTGLYKSGTDAMGIATNGTSALTINSSQAAAFTGALTTVGKAGIGGAVSSVSILGVGATNPLTGVDQRGVIINPAFTSAATTRGIGIISSATSAASAFTLPLLFQFYSQDAGAGAGSTITRSIGYYVEAPASGTSNAAIADNQAFSGSFFINSTSTNPSVLSGIAGIGGTTNAAAVLNLGATNPLTGVGQVGGYTGLRGTSAATSYVMGFDSFVGTAAASFTAPFVANFVAENGTKGAGSTITRQIHFLAKDVPTLGTNNAAIADNILFTGSYGINLSTTNASIITGPTSIGGTTTNDSASAGYVGEVLIASRLKSAATGATSTTSLNVLAAALSLTAGDWDVSGAIGFLPAATTSITLLKAAISKTTATLPATDTLGVPTSGEVSMQLSTAATVTGANDVLVALPTTRISLASTTSIFLVANATFSVSTLTVYGSLNARRIR